MRDLPIDEVENVRANNHHAAQDEVLIGERPRRSDVDDHADQRQDIRVNPERDARGDDRA